MIIDRVVFNNDVYVYENKDELDVVELIEEFKRNYFKVSEENLKRDIAVAQPLIKEVIKEVKKLMASEEVDSSKLGDTLSMIDDFLFNVIKTLPVLNNAKVDGFIEKNIEMINFIDELDTEYINIYDLNKMFAIGNSTKDLIVTNRGYDANLEKLLTYDTGRVIFNNYLNDNGVKLMKTSDRILVLN